MVINRITIDPKTTFKDLNLGDIFAYVNKEIDKKNTTIYMRCGDYGIDHERSAVNLETGIICCFDNDAPVQILEADMTVKI